MKELWEILAAMIDDAGVSWLESYLKAAKMIVLKSGLMVLSRKRSD